MRLPKWAMVVTALCVVLLLAIFGIDKIGGDTWVSASVPVGQGWVRDVSPLSPHHPTDSPMLLPAIFVAALAIVAVFDALSKSAPPAAPGPEEPSEAPAELTPDNAAENH